MLYVHGGLGRTGTTSLQAALRQHRHRLAEVGVIYPDQWRKENGDAHHGIPELLEPASAHNGETDAFKGFLRSNQDQTVLLSTEHLSISLAKEYRAGLLDFFSAASRITPVTGLWTIRRADSLFTSGYLFWLWNDRPVSSPVETFDEISQLLTGWLAGLGELSEALGGRVAFSRYDSNGAHQEEILRAVGVADSVRGTILGHLRQGPRLNRGLTQKAAIAMLHLDAISARAGVEIPRPALREALYDGRIQFDGDAPCELVGSEARRTLHEQALNTSADLGFAPYMDFFAEDEIEPAEAVSLDPSVLTDTDLARILAQVHPATTGGGFALDRPKRYDWSQNGAWAGDGLRREVFFFRSNGIDLYGSLYAAVEPSLPFGVVACNSWGVEADRCDPLQREVAITAARCGGAGMVFHYAGYGDSHGDLAALDMDDLAAAAGDAVAEASRRCPGLRWILAGFMLGASVACLAHRHADAEQLLLVQPELSPSAYFERLATATAPLAPGPNPRQMLQAGEFADMAYGYPVGRHVLDRGEEANREVRAALAAFEGGGAVVRHVKPRPTDPVPRSLQRIEVPGIWRFGTQNQPRLAEAASEWLRELMEP